MYSNTNNSHLLPSLTRGVLILALTIGLWSCGSVNTQRSTRPGDGSMLSKKEFIAKYGRRSLPISIDGRGNMYLQSSGKEISTGIRMALSPNQYFELSARPLGMIEVGRVTVDAHHGLLALDRINKRGFKEERLDYWSKEAEQRLGFSPLILRSVVQNEPFDALHGGWSVLNGMKMDYVGRRYHFYMEKNGVQILHYFSQAGNLVESSFVIPGEVTISARYTDFTALTSETGHRPYPQMIELKVNNLGKVKPGTHTLTIELTRLTAGDAPQIREDMSIPAGYKEITIEELIKVLKAL